MSRDQEFIFRPVCNPAFMPPWCLFKKDPVKRKLALDDDEILPSKMHISEERMVSQLNGIHLSTDFTSHGTCTIECNVEEPPKVDESLPKLVLCDQLKDVATTSTQILPQRLLEQCQRPTNALVLWQPPGDLEQILGFAKEEKKEEEEKIDPVQPRDVDMMEEEDDNNNNNNQPLNFGFFGRTI